MQNLRAAAKIVLGLPKLKVDSIILSFSSVSTALCVAALHQEAAEAAGFLPVRELVGIRSSEVITDNWQGEDLR